MMVSILATVFLLVLARGLRVGSLVVMVVGLGLLPVVIAMVLSSDQSNQLHTEIFIAGCTSLLIGCGYYRSSTVRTSPLSATADRHDHSNQRARGIQHRFIVSLVLLACGGSILHWLTVGVPLLSNNVEVERFADGAAYLGIPARMVQIGLPVATGMSLIRCRAYSISPFRYWPFVVGFVAMLTNGVFSGFKSGILAVLTVLLLIAGIAGYRLSRRVLLAAIVGNIAAGIFALSVIESYGTYDGSGRVDALVVRLTERTVDGPRLVMQARGSGRFGDTSLASDAEYFLAKYVSLGDLRTAFAYQERVSAQITGTPLSRKSFLVPVTTTAVGDLFHDAGVWGALIGGFLTGRVLRFFASRVTNVKGGGGVWGVWGVCATLGIYTFILKGGFLYSAINYSAVATLFSAVYLISSRKIPLEMSTDDGIIPVERPEDCVSRY